MIRLLPTCLIVCLLFVSNLAAEDSKKESADSAADKQVTDTKDKDSAEQDSITVLPGHSAHGEAFNEGARQKAYLMDGMSNVTFPATVSEPLVQKFINQGMAQMHGFWNYEAERSFRQAVMIDKDCAIGYWGLALANLNNDKRAKEFIAKAVELKEKTTDREKKYIDALNAYIKADKGKRKERSEAYAQALEKIVYEYPDDIEAKALLALELWRIRYAGGKITSYLAVNALQEEIFQVNPMHPAHHYRIHLWDHQRPEMALKSAALCGQSSPGIAHMWHMPGHIYSRLKRYNDACWQQEASARVDHAHMMRDRVLPDQIHNFAHNNEWLIRNLIHCGRVNEAVDLAKNMVELPRHPKYNTLSRRNSYSYGRMRLLQVLKTYELWPQLLQLSETAYLEPTDDDKEQIKRLRAIGTAHANLQQQEQAEQIVAQLQKRIDEQKSQRDKAGEEAEQKKRDESVDQKKIDEAVAKAVEKAKKEDKNEEQLKQLKDKVAAETRDKQLEAKKKDIQKAKNDARRPFDNVIREAEKTVNGIQGHIAVVQQDFQQGYDLLKKAGGESPMRMAWLKYQTDEKEKALEEARKYVESHKNEVQPLAWHVRILWEAGEKEKAKQTFQQLREISSPIDLDTPVFQRLAAIAKQCEFPEDWRIVKPAAADVGDRPELDSLGPFRWKPLPAEPWQLTMADGKKKSLADYQDKPLVVIFYLGFGCLHCAEQLHAFAPKYEEFEKAGISIVAISSDDTEGLKKSIENYTEGKMPFPLVSDESLETFRKYRCYDDFEETALHGTFIIDSKGLIRWQDISYEPFMEVDFVLKEAQRLFAQ